MRDQIGRLTERLSAKITPVRLLSGMRVGVFSHVGLLVKPFSAVVACEWSDIGMNHHVCGQCGGPLERFTANLARILAMILGSFK